MSLRDASFALFAAGMTALSLSCGGGGAHCVSGTTQVCACSATSMGIQACNADGTFGTCTCGPAMDGGASDGGHGDGAVHLDLGPDFGPADCAHPDADGDGHAAIACGGDDCDDHDPNRYPTNHEVCDPTHDEDCNVTTLGPDVDLDGFPSTACCNTQTDGTLLCGTDCDDTRATINPSAVETCNMIDDNCNGMIDEGVSHTCYTDADGDGYAAAAATSTTDVCGACPAMTTPTAPGPAGGPTTDCDDTAGIVGASAHPGAPEVCDGVDNNCDGNIDEGTMQLCYRDADGDNYRDTGTTSMRCTCDMGWLTASAPADCCDSDINAHPGVTAFSATTDACGSFDWNCDGTAERDPGGPSDPTIYCWSPTAFYPRYCGCTGGITHTCIASAAVYTGVNFSSADPECTARLVNPVVSCGETHTVTTCSGTGTCGSPPTCAESDGSHTILCR